MKGKGQMVDNLGHNDTIFKSLPTFYENLEKDKGEQFGPCFVSGMPGSFYERLFPSRSLHFIHSSYSLHWLSNVPGNLENNKANIYMAKSSPPNVYKAYLEQFQRDFSSFLSLRSEEIISKGRMVLTFIGRSITDPSSKDCCYIWELLTKSFLELVDEGLVEATKVDSFNLPYYTPCEEELNRSPINCGARGPWSRASSSSLSVDLQPVSSLQSPFSIFFRLQLIQESLTASEGESGSLSTHKSGPHVTFVGVYDGHGGPETSLYITDHLFQHLKRFTTEQQSMSVDVIQKAYQATEEGFMSIVTKQWLMKPQVAAVGSCCLVGVICYGTLYIANCGDSRAVLGRVVKATGEVLAIQQSAGRSL
ncbi:hypothetical protein LWI28_011124 [Acer negundo]|uniref:protein-serine/threonine phosphatase n=1 Tax=Acer negundo TaxID=4023 RepID=A0AAD5IMQ0_ACENE|nr:hypothetical protein LWI28_011124 [Acer negundo]